MLYWYMDSSAGEQQNLMIKHIDLKMSWLKVYREFQDCREKSNKENTRIRHNGVIE